MPIIIPVGGSGGAKLDITAYSAVGSLPASEAAGALAVITSTALGDVYVSADQPSSPSSGDVWVWIGGKSRAPIALTDLFTIHPRALYQYNGSAWVLLEGYVFPGSHWVEITLAIYDHGLEILEIIDITSLGSNTNNVPFTKEAAAITWSGSSTYGSNRYLYTSNAIDLTGIDAIQLAYSISGSNPFIKIVIAASQSTTVIAYQSGTVGSGQTAQLDVSSFSGTYYIGVQAGFGSSGSETGSITELTLIKS